MIEQLYRVFYVIFAMELAAILLFPIMLLLRLIMHKLPKSYTVWMWRLYFLRILCPIAISSPFCIVSGWNRSFHRILASLGLTIVPEQGFLRSWSCVFQHSIRTTVSYRICAFVWVIGVISLAVGIMVWQRRIREEIRAEAVALGEGIYQAAVATPIQEGLFRCRYYLPREVDARQTRYILAHMEAQRRRHSVFWRYCMFGVTLLHWFNPLVWCALELAKADEAMACDELAVREMGQAELMPYIQSLINAIKEGTSIPYTVGLLYEKHLERRSARMLYWQKPDLRRNLLGILCLSVLLFYLFLLRPMQIAWNGGTWGAGSTEQEVQTEPREEFMVAETKVTSPSGLARTVRLQKQKSDSGALQAGDRYDLQMLDSMGNQIDSYSIAALFERKEIPTGEITFPERFMLYTGDYNGDGATELMIGQPMEWSESQTAETEKALYPTEESSESSERIPYIYLVVNMEEEGLRVVSEPVYAMQSENMYSAPPGTEEEMKDLFYVDVPGGRNYYVWDSEQNQYNRQKMTQEELNQHKVASQGTQDAGVAQSHTLDNSKGKTVVTVNTETDTTGSELIKSVLIGDGSEQKEMDKVEGYYCDIQWATEQGGTEEQFAVLTYNGTKARTFYIYDVINKRVYYQQEDGNQLLSEVFRKYNGKDITFQEGGVVLYSLLEKNKEVLTINFAADADGDITVQGSYQYDCEKKTTSNLAFNQTTSSE